MIDEFCQRQQQRIPSSKTVIFHPLCLLQITPCCGLQERYRSNTFLSLTTENHREFCLMTYLFSVTTDRCNFTQCGTSLPTRLLHTTCRVSLHLGSNATSLSEHLGKSPDWHFQGWIYILRPWNSRKSGRLGP